ncbi:MAG: GTPase domain-containing protein [Planctomycetota bacterium]|jgi:GTPase SAR1 family protein
MRTLLSQFCEAFDATVRPILKPISEANAALNDARGDLGIPEVRAELLDLQHRIQGLVDKVAEQQAYVLLFGPLKSGKSTLMNALAGTYVSEVSSLPAYPCMVYLSHADERVFYVSRYSGEIERFTEPAALYGHVNGAHEELASKLREAEAADIEFDPSRHYQDAIRKVDVRLPAGDLAQSGAVLVDTPGLYSRMKFGYDRMTKEFRDSASCAIFVVKSDNLFLEQVFEEFEDLLELFSRIFLVVNLDTTKSDLSPDGSLVPSLEQEDPLRIIDAFENLAMSAPLKEAADEGRLKIYPVDLLRAASHRLSAGAGEAPAEPARGQANFDAFLEDLTEYLNSTDYLVAFLGDSLRRAGGLLEDLEGICDHDSIAALRAHADALDAQRQEQQRRRHAVHRLGAFDWRVAFRELDEKLAPAIRDRARSASKETEQELDRLVDQWFLSDASFESLINDDLVPRLARYEAELAGFVAETLEDEVQPGTAGLLLPSEIGADLHAAEIDLAQLGLESLGAMSKDAALGHVTAPIAVERIPVRRSLIDWVLFRSQATCRRRLFGEPSNPAARISIDRKTRRLGEDARRAIRRELDLFKSRFFVETVQRAHQHLVSRYADCAVDAMAERLEAREEAIGIRLQELVDALMERREVLGHIASVQARAAEVRGGVDELSASYGQTEPEKLIQPAPSGGLPSAPQIEEGVTPLAAIPMLPSLNAAAAPEELPEGEQDVATAAPSLVQVSPAPVVDDAAPESPPADPAPQEG